MKKEIFEVKIGQNMMKRVNIIINNNKTRDNIEYQMSNIKYQIYG